jgi:hypothetical protein
MEPLLTKISSQVKAPKPPINSTTYFKSTAAEKSKKKKK